MQKLDERSWKLRMHKSRSWKKEMQTTVIELLQPTFKQVWYLEAPNKGLYAVRIEPHQWVEDSPTPNKVDEQMEYSIP